MTQRTPRADASRKPASSSSIINHQSSFIAIGSKIKMLDAEPIFSKSQSFGEMTKFHSSPCISFSLPCFSLAAQMHGCSHACLTIELLYARPNQSHVCMYVHKYVCVHSHTCGSAESEPSLTIWRVISTTLTWLLHMLESNVSVLLLLMHSIKTMSK
jgi:hypothetical protein